ncbi:hypothetical protein RIF29_27728 [Crotalaria pallida]|uniref:Uncharacterized protein n=1 Tax=Crotalaria pallida TaxID=3830 RepID=A0AAN9EQJ4_CROPI
MMYSILCIFEQLIWNFNLLIDSVVQSLIMVIVIYEWRDSLQKFFVSLCHFKLHGPSNSGLETGDLISVAGVWFGLISTQKLIRFKCVNYICGLTWIGLDSFRY